MTDVLIEERGYPTPTCRLYGLKMSRLRQNTLNQRGIDVDQTDLQETQGKVYGVEGPWMVDASIMPTIPAANTNLPTIAIAERCAAWLIAH